MQERTTGAVSRIPLIACAVLLLTVSVICLQRADGSDGWGDWSWRIVGLMVGGGAVQLLFAQVRRTWSDRR